MEESAILKESHVEARAGIDRAFDVIRNHTVHTKGYVMTALQLIEEFGSAHDKASLIDLLKEKNSPSEFATTQLPLKTPLPATKRKNTKKKK